MNMLHFFDMENDRSLLFNFTANPEKAGIPAECVVQIYKDHHNKQIIRNSKRNNILTVTYFQEDENEVEFQNMLKVVSLFNQLNSINPSFYCDNEFAEELKNFSNEHVQYLPKESKADTIETELNLLHVHLANNHVFVFRSRLLRFCSIFLF